MGGTDYLADLRDYLPKELLDRYEDQRIMVLNTMTGETIVAGIRLENNEWVREDRMVSGDRSRGAGGWHEESGAGSGTVGGNPTVVPSRLPAPAADDALWERG